VIPRKTFNLFRRRIDFMPATPNPGKNFDSAPAPASTLLNFNANNFYIKVGFLSLLILCD
jgi:hypothetical protein